MALGTAALAGQLAPPPRLVAARMRTMICVGIAVAAGVLYAYEMNNSKNSTIMTAAAVTIAGAVLAAMYFGYDTYMQNIDYRRGRFEALANIAEKDPAAAKLLSKYSSTNQRTDDWAPGVSGRSATNNFMNTLVNDAVSKI